MLGNKIKKIRKANNLTQEVFGKKLSHTKSNVSKWENNAAKPDIETLKRISKLFDVNMNTLLGDEELKVKAKSKGKLLISISNSGYTRFSKLQTSKMWSYINWICSFAIALIGVTLFIPMFVAKDGYKTKEIIMLLAGTLLVCAGIIYMSINLRMKDRKVRLARKNAIVNIYKDVLVIKHKNSKEEEMIDGQDILSIKFLNKEQVDIELNSGYKINLFNVDNSIYEAVNNIFNKGRR